MRRTLRIGAVVTAVIVRRFQRAIRIQDLCRATRGGSAHQINGRHREPAQIGGLLVRAARQGERPVDERSAPRRRCRTRGNKIVCRPLRALRFDTCGTGRRRAGHGQRRDRSPPCAHRGCAGSVAKRQTARCRRARLGGRLDALGHRDFRRRGAVVRDASSTAARFEFAPGFTAATGRQRSATGTRDPHDRQLLDSGR